MPDPIEDNAVRDAALLLASVADATFNSPPDNDPSSTQPWDVRGVRWAAWIRDVLTSALYTVEAKGRCGASISWSPNAIAYKHARAALTSLAPDVPLQSYADLFGRATG